MSDVKRYIAVGEFTDAEDRKAMPFQAAYATVVLASDYDALAAELHSATSRLHEVAFACATAEQERDALRAEVDRLRQALDRINFRTKAYADDCRGMPEYSTLVVAEIARTALETTK